MEHMSNIFSTSFGINFAKLTRVWLASISLTAKINSLLFWATLYMTSLFKLCYTCEHIFVVSHIFTVILVRRYRMEIIDCYFLFSRCNLTQSLSPFLKTYSRNKHHLLIYLLPSDIRNANDFAMTLSNAWMIGIQKWPELRAKNYRGKSSLRPGRTNWLEARLVTEL